MAIVFITTYKKDRQGLPIYGNPIYTDELDTAGTVKTALFSKEADFVRITVKSGTGSIYWGFVSSGAPLANARFLVNDGASMDQALKTQNDNGQWAAIGGGYITIAAA